MAKRKGPAGASTDELLLWAAETLGVPPEKLDLTGFEVQTDIHFRVEQVMESGWLYRRPYQVRLVGSYVADTSSDKPAATLQVRLQERFETKQVARSTVYEGEDGSVALPCVEPDLISTIAEHRLRAIEEERESAAAEEVRSRLMHSDWWERRSHRPAWVVYEDGAEPSSLQVLFTERAAAEELIGPSLPDPVLSRGDDRLWLVPTGPWFAVFRGHQPNVLHVSDTFYDLQAWVRANIGAGLKMQADWTGDRFEAGGRVVRIAKERLVEGDVTAAVTNSAAG